MGSKLLKSSWEKEKEEAELALGSSGLIRQTSYGFSPSQALSSVSPSLPCRGC